MDRIRQEKVVMDGDLWIENELEDRIYRLHDQELLVYTDDGELIQVTQIIRKEHSCDFD